VTPKQLTNFRLDAELLDALRLIKEREGLPIAVQVRKALETWVKKHGVKMKTQGKRAKTRNRSGRH
jgi:hypothetical protein